jgi:hypothetical protein
VVTQIKKMMSTNISVSEEWVNREDSKCRQDRLERLNWLTSKTPETEYWKFSGALISKYLYEEARYCFVYGQFLATIVLGLSYIEHTLASQFYAAGYNNLERANISTLLKEALTYGWIDQKEFDNLQHAREIRNPVTHFRRPGYDDTIEYRAVLENELPYNIIEEDARYVMETALHLLGKNAGKTACT